MSLDVTLTRIVCKWGKVFDEEQVYSANYTHNMVPMAQEAGLYDVVWRPDENGIETAEGLIGPLRTGIALMESDPDRFRKHNPPNGWGDYEGFLDWLKRYLEACERYPEATVEVSR